MRTPIRTRSAWFVPVIAGAAALAGATASPAAAVTCDRYAANGGSDANPGSATRPYATAQKLADSLGPGQTGCLAAGQSFTGPLRVGRGGEPGRPLVITSGAGGRAVLRGRIWVTPQGHDVTIDNLVLDGRNPGALASPEISADRVTIRNSDISNSNTGICLVLGKTETEYAATVHDVVVQGNRIHDCGVMPRTNQHHGIYVEASRSARITDNWIYDNADRGIQLFPDAQGTLIERNVIDGNGVGVIFSGWRGWSSSGNIVRNNVITNSARHNVESWWDGVPPGSGNVVTANCIAGGHGAYGDIAPESGFDAYANLMVDPQYVNRAVKDFRVASGSRCADKVPSSAPPPAAAPVVRTPSTTTPTSPGAGAPSPRTAPSTEPAGPSDAATGIGPSPGSRVVTTPGPIRLRVTRLTLRGGRALRIGVDSARPVRRVVVRWRSVRRTIVVRPARRTLTVVVRVPRIARVTVTVIDASRGRRTATVRVPAR